MSDGPGVESSRLAFLYPGQGAQYVGMGRSAHDAFPEAREVFEEADAALGEPLSRICFQGDEDTLRRTENTQPALLTVSVAVDRVLQARGLRPAWMAGHSLGQYSALVAAESLELATAVRLVRRRGRYMQEAVPEGMGAMAALIGLGAEAVEELCALEEFEGVVDPANYNAPGQVVVAGERDAVERLVELARECGAKRAVRLDVSAPFHCSMMRPAAERLAGDLEEAGFVDPRVPVIDNVDARPLEDGEAARRSLVRQVTAPVRWTESVRWMADAGAGAYVEVGAGRVLSGLGRRILGREAEFHPVETAEEIDELLEAMDD